MLCSARQLSTIGRRSLIPVFQSRFVLALDAPVFQLTEAVLAACCVATAAVIQLLDTESVQMNPSKWHDTGWTIVLLYCCSAVRLPAYVCFAGHRKALPHQPPATTNPRAWQPTLSCTASPRLNAYLACRDKPLLAQKHKQGCRRVGYCFHSI